MNRSVAEHLERWAAAPTRGASGNVATEDVVDLFEAGGLATGVDLARLVEASAWLEDEVLHRPLPGRVYRALRGSAQTRKGTRDSGSPAGG